MFPIFIFTGMGSEPQNAFLPPCGCFRRKQKQQMPCAAAALPVKKIPRKDLRAGPQPLSEVELAVVLKCNIL